MVKLTFHEVPTMRGSGAVLVLCAVLAGCVHAPQTGARYVAMGSSFAAGPGVGTPADQPPTRCARSAQNYAHLTAQRLGLTLVDVSCSGATTAHITGSWKELPPQIDAVTRDTALVTMTIGGNDVGYIGNLGAGSCQAIAAGPCPKVVPPDDVRFAALEQSMRSTFAAVRARAPKARIVVIDYPRVLPDTGACAQTPLSSGDSALALATAERLAVTTARAAGAEGIEIVKASELSRGHDACAADPWMNGYLTADGARALVPYHPNAKGMAAIADALVEKIKQ
jgi:lysophospholipase L1-like esterase